MGNTYYVYILSNKARMLYVGITNNLERRLYEHRMKLVPGFTERFGLTCLVYYESTSDVNAAISREKEIKGWVRRKKVALINSFNPEWKDLSLEWAPPCPDALRCAQSDISQPELEVMPPHSDTLHSVQGDIEKPPHPDTLRCAQGDKTKGVSF